MTALSRGNRADRLTTAASMAMVVAAALLLPVAVGGRSPVLVGFAIPWWAMVLPFALSDGLELRFRIKQTTVFATLVEIPYVLGLFALSGRGLLLAHLLGAVIALVALRYRPTMLAFNVSGFALDGVFALVVFHALVGPETATALTGWVGCVLAMMVPAAGTAVRSYLVLRFRGQTPDEQWAWSSLLTAVVNAINATLAFLAMRLVVADTRLVWLVGGMALVLVAVYRNYISLLSNHEGLNRLYDSTRTFELVTAHDNSAMTMLDQSLELLGAERAELVLGAQGSGRPRCFRSEHDRPARELTEDEIDPTIAELIDTIDDTGAERFGRIDVHDRHAMVGRLQGSEESIGLLRVSMFSGSEFSEGDRRLFEMFVNHASVALQNSQLVDQLREEVAQREHEALHDALTALPNRVLFDLQTRRALAMRRADELVAVALIDIDHFKEVNDTLGHHHGDSLLSELAKRLERLGGGDGLVVSRLGGDEFAVLITGVTEAAQINDIAVRVKAAIEESLEIASVRIDIGASVGVAVVDPAEPVADDSILLRQADVAMYIAKRQHRGIVFYDRADDPYSPKRLSLAADLRHAVERGEIEAYFQPEIDLHTGKVISVEALARWTHPEHGSIVPDQFIPIAEQSGLIRDLTYLMLEQSLERIRQWRSHGFHLHVAVNLSVRCLSDEHLVEKVQRHLELAGLGPEVLTLEVTEGTIMADPEHALAVLCRLHDAGIRLSIDDFGMGYSSLAQLKRMPVGQLKIDKSFVTYVTEDADDAAIVKSVTDLGHNLHLEVIAEGCEDAATLDRLTELGCDSVQGFYLGRPMTADQTLRWLREREQPAAERVSGSAAGRH
ncbi:MAG: EAL domain-containing protein [Acidimicrobiales bacterium]